MIKSIHDFGSLNKFDNKTAEFISSSQPQQKYKKIIYKILNVSPKDGESYFCFPLPVIKGKITDRNFVIHISHTINEYENNCIYN